MTIPEFWAGLCEKALPDLRWLIAEGCAGVSPQLDCYSITGLKLTRGLLDWSSPPHHGMLAPDWLGGIT